VEGKIMEKTRLSFHYIVFMFEEIMTTPTIPIVEEVTLDLGVELFLKREDLTDSYISVYILYRKFYCVFTNVICSKANPNRSINRYNMAIFLNLKAMINE